MHKTCYTLLSIRRCILMFVFLLQCNTDSNCPSEDCCLTTIACKEITDKPNIENLPVCQPIPNRGDPCDFSPVNTTCSCLPNFICHPSGSTSHKDPKKDKYYKYDKCLCEHRNNFKQCEKYKKYKTKYKHSVCQPVPPKRLNLVRTEISSFYTFLPQTNGVKHLSAKQIHHLIQNNLTNFKKMMS